MDISDINKVASRKRMNTDAEKLREKVSRETAKIIKLKVAQDTAYWDLKEKLQQLETNHERLQQNMVEVQMQHEAVSGQFQEELRMRPDTLNKLSGTRDICEVLEEYGERLRRSVARCRADRQALEGAYDACGARVRQMAAEGARERARLAERQAAVLRQLAHAQRLLGEERARTDALAYKLERCSDQLMQREETVVTLQAEASRLALALEERAQQERTSLADRRAEEEAARARLAALERELAASRRSGADAAEALQLRTRDLEEALVAVQQGKRENAELNEQNKDKEKVIDEKDQLVRSLTAEAGREKERSTTLEAENRELAERLAEAERRRATEACRLQELERHAQTLESDLTEARQTHAASREADGKRLEELGAALAERERELDAKTGTVARLMADLKGEAQARYRADAALLAARRELGAELDTLRAALRDKDAELAAQMAVLLDVRGEKARLQDKIGGMQATIDNVRKELTGPAPPPPPPAERDTPAPRGDDLLYSFLSDGSVDSDALDAREVGRRFAAIARGAGAAGAAPAPLSLSQLKKDFKIKRRTFFKSKRLENESQKRKE